MKRILFGVLLVGISTVQAADSLTTNTTSTPEIGVADPAVVGPEKPVFVVNTSDDPVPVRGEVEVVNVPDVHVLGPVPVTTAVGTPLHIRGLLQIDDGEADSGFLPLFTVPEGQMYVVTHMSVTLADPSPVDLRIEIHRGPGTVVEHDVPAERIGPSFAGGPGAWAISVPITLYVEAGDSPGCKAVRESTTGRVSGRCGMSGYLVDVPQE